MKINGAPRAAARGGAAAARAPRWCSGILAVCGRRIDRSQGHHTRLGGQQTPPAVKVAVAIVAWFAAALTPPELMASMSVATLVARDRGTMHPFRPTPDGAL